MKVAVTLKAYAVVEIVDDGTSALIDVTFDAVQEALPEGYELESVRLDEVGVE